SLDNLLRPKLIGGKAKVHPVLVLLGALGGIAFIGPVGFLIGPIVTALLKAFVDIYETEHVAGHM
ncbi:MAG: AI-2E family transporter, partial [Candidatus Woesearchaeota archaeon]